MILQMAEFQLDRTMDGGKLSESVNASLVKLAARSTHSARGVDM